MRISCPGRGMPQETNRRGSGGAGDRGGTGRRRADRVGISPGESRMNAADIQQDDGSIASCAYLLDPFGTLFHFNCNKGLLVAGRVAPRFVGRASSGTLVRFEAVPFQIKCFRLNRVSDDAAGWLEEMFNREGQPFGIRIELKKDRSLTLRWNQPGFMRPSFLHFSRFFL